MHRRVAAVGGSTGYASWAMAYPANPARSKQPMCKKSKTSFRHRRSTQHVLAAVPDAVAAAVLRSSHASRRIIDSTDLQKIDEQAICCELCITTSIIVSKLRARSLSPSLLSSLSLLSLRATAPSAASLLRTYVSIKKVVYVYKYPLN
jgi:hypothetical protein